MRETIRAVIQEFARLTPTFEDLTDDDDLYQAGMTSHASVNVMLALEDRLEIVFPDRMLRRGIFESISSIHTAVEELLAAR